MPPLISIVMENVKRILSDVWDNFSRQIVQYSPKLITALIILVAGFIIGKVLGVITSKILKKVGLDEYVSKTRMSKILERMETTPSSFVSRIVRWSIYAIAILLTIYALEIDVLEEFISDAFKYIPQVIGSIIVLFLGVTIVDLFSETFADTMSSRGIKNPQLMESIVRYVLYSVVGVVFLSLILPSSSIQIVYIIFAAFFGSVGLALALGIGLGLREVGQSIMYGIYETFGGKIDIGDEIEVRGYRGTVEDLGILNTTIRTEEGDILILPNAILATEEVRIIRKGREEGR